jgi:hypothetical protein
MQDPHARSDVEQGLGLHLAVAHHANEPSSRAGRPAPSVGRQVLPGSDGPEMLIGGFAVARHRSKCITPPNTAAQSATGFPANRFRDLLRLGPPPASPEAGG